MAISEAEIKDAGGRTHQDNLDDWKYEVVNGDTRLGIDDWIAHRFPVIDRFGARWPDDYDVCPDCSQPDNCGDCNHQPLSPDQIQWLGGVPKETA